MDWKESVSLWQRLERARKPVMLYGMGNGADKILDELARRGIAAAGVFASDEFCRGQIFRGFRVINYKQARERFGEMIVLVAFGTQLPEVMERIKRIAREQELYIPDVPVYGGGIFDKDYLMLHEAELRRAYALLADGLSRETFRDMVEYKLSGKPEYLYRCESRPAEACKNILKLGNSECYVDVGAYTGDTIHDFIEMTDGYERIFSIEPDARNFARLKSAVEGFARIVCWNVAAHEREGRITFAQRGGRNSAASGAGWTVPANSLDLSLIHIYCHEDRFLAKLGHCERVLDIVECLFRVFIEHPHCFRSVDRRTAADGNNYVRLEFPHCLRAAVNGFYRRIRFDALEELGFKPGLVQDVFQLVKKTKFLHRTSACYDDCFLVAFEAGKLVHCVGAEIEVAWECKSCHN